MSFFLKFILKDIKKEELCNYVFVYGHQILNTFHLLWDALNASSALTYLCPNNVTIKVFYNPYQNMFAITCIGCKQWQPCNISHTEMIPQNTEMW